MICRSFLYTSVIYIVTFIIVKNYCAFACIAGASYISQNGFLSKTLHNTRFMCQLYLVYNINIQSLVVVTEWSMGFIRTVKGFTTVLGFVTSFTTCSLTFRHNMDNIDMRNVRSFRTDCMWVYWLVHLNNFAV